jgi:hypothetical protein
MIVGLLKVRRKEAPAMAGADRMTIEEVVRKVLLDEHAGVIREAVKAVAAQMMELEVSELVGAERGERRPEDRATHRNGYRPRRWDTRAGEIELQIPKICEMNEAAQVRPFAERGRVAGGRHSRRIAPSYRWRSPTPRP